MGLRSAKQSRGEDVFRWVSYQSSVSIAKEDKPSTNPAGLSRLYAILTFGNSTDVKLRQIRGS